MPQIHIKSRTQINRARQHRFRRCRVCGLHNHVKLDNCQKCGAPLKAQPKKERPRARQQLDREVEREKRERLELALDHQMNALRLPKARPNYKFHPSRNWRFDRAYPEIKLAIEVEGGLRVLGEDGQRGGRHNRPEGYEEDCRKYTEAAVLGWRIIRVTAKMIQDRSAVDAIDRALVGSDYEFTYPEKDKTYLKSLL